MNTYDFYFEDMTIRFADKNSFFPDGAEIWLSLSNTGFVIADSFNVLQLDDMDQITLLKLSDKAKKRLGIAIEPDRRLEDADFDAYTKKVFSVLNKTKDKDFDILKWSMSEAYKYLHEAVLRPTPGMQLYI